MNGVKSYGNVSGGQGVHYVELEYGWGNLSPQELSCLTTNIEPK